MLSVLNAMLEQQELVLMEHVNLALSVDTAMPQWRLMHVLVVQQVGRPKKVVQNVKPVVLVTTAMDVKNAKRVSIARVI